MSNPKITVVVWIKDTNEIYYRDLLDSIVAQLYDNRELYIMDEGNNAKIEMITSEFFPEDRRVHYRKLKTSKGKAYAYNIGFHFALLDNARNFSGEDGYLFVIDEKDRFSPNAFSKVAEAVEELSQKGRKMPDILYSDHDELIGVDRMNPHFKPQLDKELLLHKNYIGDCIGISYEAARKLGEFRENLSYALIYDYLLRAVENQMRFYRIPSFLYHKRISAAAQEQTEKTEQRRAYDEGMLVASAHLKRCHIDAVVREMRKRPYWGIDYWGKDVLAHQKEYLLLREKGVKIITGKNLEKMYGILRQKDVAVVGACFLKSGFSYESCGYLYADDGQIYPAFYGQKKYRNTYEDLAEIPHEVSMTDMAYCMIDAKAYRKLGGFDSKLRGRDRMLDFCLRAKKAGLRVVVNPLAVVRNTAKEVDSSQASHERLMEKHGERIREGDDCYNPNLPMGLENFKLDF